MYIVTRMLSVIAVCCCIMTSVVAADGERKLLASKQGIAGALVAPKAVIEYQDGDAFTWIYDIDIETTESAAANNVLNLVMWNPETNTVRLKYGKQKIEDGQLYRVCGVKVCESGDNGRYRFEPLGYEKRSFSDKTVYVEVEKVASSGDQQFEVRWAVGKEPVCSCNKIPAAKEGKSEE